MHRPQQTGAAGDSRAAYQTAAGRLRPLLPFRSAVGAQDSGKGTAMPGEDDEPQQCADEPRQDAGRHREVEGQNVDQNRRNNDQSQRNKASTQQQEAANDLEPKGNHIEMRGIQGANELSRHTGGHGRMQEVEKSIQAEKDKDEAQQNACDENSDLHGVSLRKDSFRQRLYESAPVQAQGVYRDRWRRT